MPYLLRPALNRTLAAALAILVLLTFASLVVVQANAPDPNLDTAQRDDVVLEHNGGGASGAVDSGTDAHDPNLDTAKRDDAVPDDDGGASGTVGSGTDGRDPDLDTARRDDAVPGDDGGGASGATGSGTDANDPNYDTAERDDVVPDDDGGASGATGSGTDASDPNYDTAKRDDVMPDDDSGASGAAGSGTDASDPNYDTAKRDDVVPDDDGGASGTTGSGTGASDPNHDTAKRDEAVPADDEGGATGSSATAPAPTGLRVTSDTDDSVSLRWTAVTNAAKYKVEYKASSSTRWLHATYTSGTTATVDDLDCEAAYNFRVRARGDGIPYSYSYGSASSSVSETTDKCRAPAPTGFRVTSDTDDSVSLRWTAVTDADKYKVEYKTSSATTWRHATYSSGTTATVNNLSCNAGYNFRVRARGDGSPYSYTYGDPSSSVSETTDKCKAPAPTGLKVTSDTDESVSLSWKSVTDGAYYKVEYKASSSSTWLHAKYSSGTTATVDDLDCNSGYNFRVRARGDGSPYSLLYGNPSSSVSETTDKCIIGAPTGLRVTSDTDDSVSLSWSSLSEAAKYKVEYKASSSSSWLHATYTSGTTATVDDLNCNASYNFRVSARGDGIPYSTTYGDPSTSVSETTDKCIPPAPTGLKVTSDTEESVSLSWTSLTGAALYKVEYKASSSSSWLHATYTSSTTTTVDDLNCNTGYNFRVRARGNGTTYSTTYGDPSSSVSETTDKCNAPPPTGLTVDSDTDDSVSLSWTAVTDAARYKVEYKASSSSTWLHATFTSGTTATVDDLDSATGYDFRVRARGDGSPYSTLYGDPSSSVSETTDKPTPPAPTGLTATSHTHDSVSLSWTALTDAAKYKVEYKASSSTTWLHATYASATTATVDSLEQTTEYDFRVRARGDGSPYSILYGEPSNSVSETTDEHYAPAPTGLSATASTQTGVTLSWTAVTDAQYYKLERGASSTGPWTSVSDTISTSSYTATGLDCNTTYYFKVSARGDGSPYSTTFGSQSSGDVSRSTTDCPNAPAPLGLEATASTDTTATLSWTAVTDAQYYKIERGASSTGPWTSVSDTISTSSHTATGLDCNTTYYFKVSARGDGSPYSTTFGSQSAGDVSRSTTACPDDPTATPTPTPTPDPCVTDIGEMSTSTRTGSWTSSCASTHRATPASYAHFYVFTLERQSTVEINLTSTENTYLFLLNGEGKNAAVLKENDDFAGTTNSRILADLPPGGYTIEATTSTSRRTGSFTLQTKVHPQVAIEVNKLLPAKGDTVQLTASVTNAPEGQTATYLWEKQNDDGTWSAMSSTTNTASETSTDADVRTYRVTVSYGSTSLTDPTTVVWDELNLFTGLITAVSSGFTADDVGGAATRTEATRSYFSAEGKLRKCVNDDSRTTVNYTSLASIMAAYTGDTKTVVDDCDQRNSYFTSMQSALVGRLDELAPASSVRGRLLLTERGALFKTTIGDPAMVKLIADIIAAQPPARGVSGSTGDVPTILWLDCFKDLSTTPTDAQMYEALNCITFKTPHDYWVEIGNPDQSTARDTARDKYMKAFCKETDPQWGSDCPQGQQRHNWIGYGDLICSPREINFAIPVNFLPACLKHDLTWNGLQGIVGGSMPPEEDKMLDSAWSPRNKFLADAQFLIDNICAMRTGAERKACIAENDDYWEIVGTIIFRLVWTGWKVPLPVYDLPSVAAWGVAGFNDNDWPVTKQDIEHARTKPYFLECAAPRMEGTLTVTRADDKYTVDASATSINQCVDDIVIDGTEWCWEYTPPQGKNREYSKCSDDPLPAREGAKLVGVRMTPADKVPWAGEHYQQPMSVTLTGSGPWVITFTSGSDSS